MLRHSPLGFLLGTAIEVAVIVFLVSLLPRANLRPTTKPNTSLAVSPVSWISEVANVEQPPASNAARRETTAAPALIESSPQRRDYVEQRLDRSSQQLLNSVGSFVTQTADQSLAKPVLPTTASNIGGAAAAPNLPISRPGRGSSTTPHRPWIRY